MFFVSEGGSQEAYVPGRDRRPELANLAGRRIEPANLPLQRRRCGNARFAREVQGALTPRLSCRFVNWFIVTEVHIQARSPSEIPNRFEYNLYIN